ncbi:MAG: GAF domain-containing protein, partial [Anaerolineae bacterium]|nr:GAF domain-containing protein [Anaerolineae bacterium]
MSAQPSNLSFSDDLQQEIVHLKTIHSFTSAISQNLELDPFLHDMVMALAASTPCNRLLIFMLDPETGELRFKASQPPKLHEAIPALKVLPFTLFNQDDPVISAWHRQETRLITPADAEASPAAAVLLNALGETQIASVPLLDGGSLQAVILADQFPAESTPQAALDLLRLLTTTTAPLFHNVLVHHRTMTELAANMREQYILQQIDRELSETIDLSHVFDMTLDWALRFTNAQAASLALYDEATDTLRFMVEYGYEVDREQLEAMRREYNGGITHRVARAGYVEIVPDVSMDKDFIRVHNSTQSQMSVPVMREDRVIAVMSLESKRLNGFNDTHLDFVEKLASRAGIAIDNARLYEETEIERQKLSYILGSTADVVIVVGPDDRLLLINQAAIATLRLYPHENYLDRTLYDVFGDTPLAEIYRRAASLGENLIVEMPAPNERTLHVKLTHHEGIGWIIVMQDITPFKEMDQLKSELIATVSHDLKQPLSVMQGYSELLMMQNTVNAHGTHFIEMIRRSIVNMRQLIDDLLDLAKIESGIQLQLQPIEINTVINDCIDSLRPAAQNKSMMITNEAADSLPSVIGDYSRLRQILMNLIGNAVKYTPPEGWVRIRAEQRGN